MTVLLEATPSNIDFDLVKNTFLRVKVLTRASYLIPILTNLNLKKFFEGLKSLFSISFKKARLLLSQAISHTCEDEKS